MSDGRHPDCDVLLLCFIVLHPADLSEAKIVSTCMWEGEMHLVFLL